MKAFITTNEPEIGGYLYISPLKGHNYNNLTNVIDDNECSEILAPNAINYIPFNQLQKTVEHWITRLSHGGKLIIGGFDLYEVAKRIVRAELHTDMANFILYGPSNSVWDVQRSQINLADLCDLLKQNGLQITKKKLDGITMIVEAVRP